MKKIFSKADAIHSLFSAAEFTTTGDTVYWISTDISQPTEAEITAEVTRLQAEWDAKAYARTRKAKYDLLNQDEMRYDDVKNSTTTWVDAIDAIKLAHPKP